MPYAWSMTLRVSEYTPPGNHVNIYGNQQTSITAANNKAIRTVTRNEAPLPLPAKMSAILERTTIAAAPMTVNRKNHHTSTTVNGLKVTSSIVPKMTSPAAAS